MSETDQFPTPDHLLTKGIDRRAVIASVGVAAVGVAGVVALAGCGGSSNTAGAGGGSAGSGKDVIKTADIPVGGGKVYDATKIVVTQPTAGEFKAFSAICTHQGCTVAGVVNGTISCPCHASTFDAATGQVTGGPAPTPLPPKTVTVSGSSLTIS